MKLGDCDLGRVDSDLYRCSVVFLAGDAFDVDNKFLTKNLGDLAFSAFKGTSQNLNLISFTDWH